MKARPGCHEDEYLVRAVRLGVRITAVTVLLLAIYPLLPGSGPLPAAPFAGLLAAAMVVIAVIARLPGALWTGPYRYPLLYGWSLADVGLITALVALNGGGRSDLYLLYGLTSLFFAACYPTRGQIATGLATAVAYATALAFTGWHVSASAVAVRAVSLALLSVMASFLSKERERDATESKHRAALLATVAAAARDVATMEPEAVLAGVTRAVTRMGFDVSSIALLDKSRRNYRFAISEGLPESVTSGTLPTDLGITALVMAAGRTVAVDDYRTHEAAIPALAAAGFDSVVGSPLWTGGEMAGVLVGARVGGGELPTQELEAIELLAAGASRALENARRFTNLAESEIRSKHQALHDGLTGLANRRLLLERIGHALNDPARAGRRIAVVFVDLDDFKAVNDTLGHTAGDLLLVEVAGRLKSCLRSGDTAARLGGDEFAVVVADADEEGTEALVQRLLDSVCRPVDLAGVSLTIRASVGVAFSSGDDAPAPSTGGDVTQTVESLLRDADLAMYEAKRSGKGGRAVFEKAMRERLLERLTLESDLAEALAMDQFHLVYQPIVDLATNEMTGAEALLRWNHPVRGMVPPDEFVPIAEETGAIVAIGRWVLNEACNQLHRWRQLDPSWERRTISVNLSGRQLRDPGLVDDVMSILASCGVSPADLTLEVTETAFFNDTEAATVLTTLADNGVQFALDDFGTGYCTLGYLQRLPVHSIKIDKSFIEGINSGWTEPALIRSILELTRQLSLRTVAEGIESSAQLAELQSLGCQQGQGFYLSRPVPPEALVTKAAPDLSSPQLRFAT